jgi:hypothetical protein
MQIFENIQILHEMGGKNRRRFAFCVLRFAPVTVSHVCASCVRVHTCPRISIVLASSHVCAPCVRGSLLYLPFSARVRPVSADLYCTCIFSRVRAQCPRVRGSLLYLHFLARVRPVPAFTPVRGSLLYLQFHTCVASVVLCTCSFLTLNNERQKN